jgi:hypothetical protein
VQEPGTLEGSTINGQPSLTGIEDDWVKETFDISAFIGTPKLRLRFVFTSDGATSFYAAQDGGFYIDELKVIKSTTPLITLPVHFISFHAKLTPANTVELDWLADIDAKHSHFIVERSTDGQNYTAISGKIIDKPYKWTDYNPVIGKNYYRIKHYDIDGQFTYSKVNTIYFNPMRFSYAMYPNPATDDVQLRFDTEGTEAVTIYVSDLSGKVFYTNQVVINANNRIVKMNVKGWPSQTYIIKAFGKDKGYISVQKLIKQ